MPHQIVDIPGHGEIEFPDSMSDAEVVTAIQKIRATPSDTLLASRREIAKQQADAAMPQSTIATRGQAVGEGLAGGVKDWLLGAVDFAKKVSSGDPATQADALTSIPGGIYHALIDAPSAYIDAFKKGDYDEAARQAGRITTTTLPAAYGIGEAVPPLMRTGLRAVTTPEKLLTRAATNRELASQAKTEIPGSTAPAKLLSAAANVTRIPRASVYEAAARFMAKPDKAPMFSESTLPLTDSEEIPFTAPSEPSPFAGQLKPPAGPAREISFTPPRELPPFAGELKPATGPSREIAFNPPEEASPFAGQLKPPAGPAREIPMEPLERTAVKTPNVKMIEDALAPSGNKARLSTLRNAPRLAEVAPEVQGVAPGRAFDGKLMDAFRRVEGAVGKAEDAVPDTTTVPRQPITDAMKAQVEEYKARGLERSAAAVQAILDNWEKLPTDIPWNDFISRKRSFFKEGNANSGVLRRAYGSLMDATSNISQELADANYSYSVVRRAVGDANIDIGSGRRIGQVGRPARRGVLPTP